MNEGTPNDGHGIITDGHTDIVDEDNDDASFDSSDDEAVIERMKLATKKEKKRKSDDDAAAIFDCSEYEAVIDDCRDRITASPMDNVIVNDDDDDDFVWNLQQQAKSIPWIEVYIQLFANKKEHTDTKVRKRYGLDPQFGQWVSSQRDFHRNKKIRRNGNAS